MSAETAAATFLSMWISRFGVPSQTTTDRGGQFESQLFTAFATLLGTTRLRPTSYHPACNGMVERLHRHLKAAHIAHEDRDHWVSHLLLVLLGIRAALKPDLGCSCADLVYGCSLRLPAEFFCPSKPDISPSALLQRLHRSFNIVRATPSTAASHHSPNIPQDLPIATHVFPRTDSVRKSLSPPYSGPHPVLARNDKTYRVLVNGKEDTVSVDRLKPAYLENPGIVVSFAPGSSSLPTASPLHPAALSMSHGRTAWAVSSGRAL
ncbi:uncharacterized protein LOC135384707 [Ornithodoros turicata]|uniref:uncharacterized protein LOC135384707 n=1 Tax=Ornithodoros turicata TaxID=34597 RepID=UPI003139C564